MIFTFAVESVAEISANTGTGKASRCVSTVGVWTAASVVHSTLIYVCHTTNDVVILNYVGPVITSAEKVMHSSVFVGLSVYEQKFLMNALWMNFYEIFWKK